MSKGLCMSFKRNNIFGFFFFLILSILGLFFNDSYLALASSILIYLYIGSLVERKSNLHMMFFLGFSTFIFLPSLLNWYYLDISFSLYFLTSFISVFFIAITKETKVKFFIDYGKPPKIIFCIFCLFLVVFLFIGFAEAVAPMFAFLIILLSLCFEQNNFKSNFFYLTIFLLVFATYSLFFWSGFGRTVVLGWLILASLQFAYSIDFKVNKYAFGLLPGLGSTLLADRNFLELKFSGFESALNDSAFGPYRLASTFIEHSNENSLDISGFWDQIIFTFFIFIPRSFWPDKPYGFGFEYTVQNLDASLIDAGHSIAATLIGEHIYYLGYLGIFTAIMFFTILAFFSKVLYHIKGLNGNGILLFSSSMMALVWGGMTSFSARVALSSILFVFLFFLLRRFLTRKVKIVWSF